MDNNLESTQAQSPQVSFIKKFENEVKSLDDKELSNYTLKLDYLCKNFNPFDNQKNSIEIENILEDFGLKTLSQDPYNFTNIALQMLDILEGASTKKLN